jgi:hypothetical protein
VSQRQPIATKPVVYRIPGMDHAIVHRDIEYKDRQTLDIYYPPGFCRDIPIPALLFVFAGSDAGAERILGCKFKEMESYICWSRLAAASGFAAITYTNSDPAAGPFDVLAHIRRNARTLMIDASRIAVWACSGNVPLALSVVMREAPRCAVLCYGYLLDLDGSTIVADSMRKWGFVNPSAGKSIADLPAGVPLMIVRAGRDELPGLNETMDRFVTGALRANLNLTLVNHAAAPHAFDIMDDSSQSQEIIRQLLSFLRFHLFPL